MHTVVVASIASVVSRTAYRAPVNDRCTKYGCLGDNGSTGRTAGREGPAESLDLLNSCSKKGRARFSPDPPTTFDFLLFYFYSLPYSFPNSSFVASSRFVRSLANRETDSRIDF